MHSSVVLKVHEAVMNIKSVENLFSNLRRLHRPSSPWAISFFQKGGHLEMAVALV